MEKYKLSPEKITKPIQLLGAWLVGLLAVDSAFLTAVTKMDSSSWQSGALTVAAIINVPLFIGALFLLQTKFRPELQEDSYYSTYLNNRTNEVIKVPKSDLQLDQLLLRINKIENKLKSKKGNEGTSKLSKLSYGVNVNLKESINEKVESKLHELGIEIIREFGVESNKLDELVVAVAEHLPSEVVNRVLIMAKELGFQSYSYIEPFEDIDEDVLFGAYGNPVGKITIRMPKTA